MLSQSEFSTKLDGFIGKDLSSLRAAYRSQQIRKVILFSLATFAVFLGLGTFFPFLILVFLLIAWMVYTFFLASWRKGGRIDSELDVQRLIMKGIAKTVGQPFELLTHCSHPEQSFTGSKLFDFTPETYFSEDMLEIRGARKIQASRVKATEHIDAFERKGRDESSFEGWLLSVSNPENDAIAPDIPESAKLVSLKEEVKTHVNVEGPSWLAVTFPQKLFKKSFFELAPDYNNCHRFYAILNQAAT